MIEREKVKESPIADFDSYGNGKNARDRIVCSGLSRATVTTNRYQQEMTNMVSGEKGAQKF